ncbi:hypothetical protein PMAYCL1PPCAC_25723, partial [Pristionchus mayeri]
MAHHDYQIKEEPMEFKEEPLEEPVADIFSPSTGEHRPIGSEGGEWIGGEPGSRERYESIERCTLSLVHSSMCIDDNCGIVGCHMMKRVVAHTRVCKKRVECPLCEQLIALCFYHAKRCQKEGC